jgi:8-oxo-dGTP diphosphatase
MANYETVRIAVDAVIFTIRNAKLQILLHLREKEPFAGKKELPGGLLLKEETAERTLKRKLHELTGQQELFFEQFHTFTAPNRDPRERTVSIAFVALVNAESIESIPQSYDWYDCAGLPQLAFDHKQIVESAQSHLAKNINILVAKQFLPPLFALNRLQEVYELIEGKKYDNRNFRKQMLTSETVEETDQRERGVSHRPAKLFRFAVKTVNTA